MSWARFCPQVHESAGRKQPKGRGKGNPWLAGTLGNIVATGNSVLAIVYHLLSDPEARSTDLGAEHYQVRIDSQPRARNLAAQPKPSPASGS